MERALATNARLGGHIMQGHVDGTGELIAIRAVGDGYVVRVGFPSALARYIVEEGSIAEDGISLTVAALGAAWVEVAIIPHTWQATNLSTLATGTGVQILHELGARKLLLLSNHPPRLHALEGFDLEIIEHVPLT